jgi:hypothetical protein
VGGDSLQETEASQQDMRQCVAAKEQLHDKGTAHATLYCCRFFQDGTLLYRTSPHTVKTVAKSLVRNPCQHGTRPANKYEQHVHTGRYVIKVRVSLGS